MESRWIATSSKATPIPETFDIACESGPIGTTGGSRGRHLGLQPPKTARVACLSPPPPQQSVGVTYRYDYCHKSLASPDYLFFCVFILFLAFFEVRNLQIYFGIPKSCRIRCMRIEDRFKTNFHAVIVHFCSTSRMLTSGIFSMLFWTPRPVTGSPKTDGWIRQWCLW